MVWDRRDDHPPTEISYPPYSPTPSEVEAHKGKAARIDAWTKALPDPHQGSGRSVGAHSAQRSDRASASTSRDLPGLPNSAAAHRHPFSTAAGGVRSAPHGSGSRPTQSDMHRRPSVRGPVAPLLARSPFERDVATGYELPRADHLVNHAHGGQQQSAGSGTLRSRREAYFTAALDLPLDMLTEWDDNTVQPFQVPQPPENPKEKRGNFRSLLGRSKSQASLKQPPPNLPTSRSMRGVSLDPAAAAGTAGTLSKMRSMDAKLLQRASMSAAMQSTAANGRYSGTQETRSAQVQHYSHAPLPNAPASTNPSRSGTQIAQSRSAPIDLDPHASPVPPPRAGPSSNATAAPAAPGLTEHVVKLTRRTSSRGALAESANVSGKSSPSSRTPAPQNPAGTSSTQVAPVGADPTVKKSNSGPRFNGDASETQPSAPNRKQPKYPGKDAGNQMARAPSASKVQTASTVKSSNTSQSRAKSKAPPVPMVVVTTPPDEGSKRVEASVTKGKAPNPGLPQRSSSISRITRPANGSRRDTTPTPSSAAATAQPLASSQPSAPRPVPTEEKRRTTGLAGEASHFNATSTKPHTRRRVFSWLGSRNKAIPLDAKENQRDPKSKPQTVKTTPPSTQPSHAQHELGGSDTKPLLQPAQQPVPISERAPTVRPHPVLHGQSQRSSNLSHHQPAPPTLGAVDNGARYGPESRNGRTDASMQPSAAVPVHEQTHYRPPLSPPIPQAARSPVYHQQHQQTGPSSAPFVGPWPQPPPQHQSPMGTGLMGVGGGNAALIPSMASAPIRGLANPTAVPDHSAPQAHFGYQAGYGHQPGPYAHAGHPLPAVPTQPEVTMHNPVTYSHDPVSPGQPQPLPETMPAPKRPWFNNVPFFGNSNVPGVGVSEGVEERQKRMSMNADNTNLKKQVSSISSRSEDSAERTTITQGYRADPTSEASVVSMTSAKSNTSHLASLEEEAMACQSLRSLDPSKLQDHLDRETQQLNNNPATTSNPNRTHNTSPSNVQDPMLSSLVTESTRTPLLAYQATGSSRMEPPTPPPKIQDTGLITLGGGFSPLRMDWDGSTNSDDVIASTIRTIASDVVSKDGGKISGPGIGKRDACDKIGDMQTGSAGAKSAQHGESNESNNRTKQNCEENGYDLNGRSWNGTEQNTNVNSPRVSVPSASEPRSEIKHTLLSDRMPSAASPEAAASASAYESEADWTPLPLVPELEEPLTPPAERHVWLHHCGALSVLEPLEEEAEDERPLSGLGLSLGLRHRPSQRDIVGRPDSVNGFAKSIAAPSTWATTQATSMAETEREILYRVAASVERVCVRQPHPPTNLQDAAEELEVSGSFCGSTASVSGGPQTTGEARSVPSAPRPHVVVIRAE